MSQTKLVKLTPERAQTIQDAYREHLASGLSTDAADFKAAQAAIARLYGRTGRKAPYFVRLDSPFAVELYIDLYCRTFPTAQNQLRDQLRDQLWGQLRDQLRGQLRSQLQDQLRDQLWDQLRDQENRYMGTWFWGSMDMALWGWLDGGRRVGVVYPPALNSALDDHLTVCRSIGWWYPFEEFCVLTGRPELIARDDQGRLHSAAGPALRYRDGYALYAHHGVRVPGWIIEHPEEITPNKIDAEGNAETRRVMMEQYGVDRYLLSSGASIVHRDAVGLLYRKEIPDDEPIVMVRVLNSTPEPDGVMSRDEAIETFEGAAQAAVDAPANARFKEYMIRVPPGISTAHEAVAWTFGLKAEDYHPALET